MVSIIHFGPSIDAWRTLQLPSLNLFLMEHNEPHPVFIIPRTQNIVYQLYLLYSNDWRKLFAALILVNSKFCCVCTKVLRYVGRTAVIDSP